MTTYVLLMWVLFLLGGHDLFPVLDSRRCFAQNLQDPIIPVPLIPMVAFHVGKDDGGQVSNAPTDGTYTISAVQLLDDGSVTVGIDDFGMVICLLTWMTQVQSVQRWRLLYYRFCMVLFSVSLSVVL